MGECIGIWNVLVETDEWLLLQIMATSVFCYSNQFGEIKMANARLDLRRLTFVSRKKPLIYSHTHLLTQEEYAQKS